MKYININFIVKCIQKLVGVFKLQKIVFVMHS